MGDPGGIGPEVIIKALAAMPRQRWQARIYGSARVLGWEEAALAAQGLDVSSWQKGVEIVDVADDSDWSQRPLGDSGAAGARMQWQALMQAMGDAKSKAIDAIVTAPWNKALFEAAGMDVVGHTETLADYFGVDDVVMMLGGERLKVALVTTHISLAQVPKAISKEAIIETAAIAIADLRERFGVAAPKVAICGLNPHAGEQGHMGREEIDVVAPAVEALRRRYADQELTVEGPFAADTLFAKFRDRRAYDCVICMYHDQGLIPLKLLHFGESANFTLGLPIVRTSVDHGTAYDIAGQGVADAGSMIYAIDAARRICGRQQQRQLSAGSASDDEG